MRECYEELGRDPPSARSRWSGRVQRASLFVVEEPRGHGWVPWMAEFSETGGLPG